MSKFQKICIPNAENFIPLESIHVTNSQSYKIIASSISEVYLISKNNDLYIFSLNFLEKNLVMPNISQISCGFTMCCFISTAGQCFVQGEDPENYGLLGVKNVFSLNSPLQILNTITCKSVSVGKSHVGLISDDGKLYTWGTGLYGELGNFNENIKQLPLQVQSTKVFMIKQVVCAEKLTCFSTAGGFFYIFGVLPTCGLFKYKGKTPYTVKSLEKKFIAKIEICSDFVAIMTDNKDVFLIDGCLEAILLPGKFIEITACNNFLYSIGKNDYLLYQWKSDNGICRASKIECRIFSLEQVLGKKIRMFGSKKFSFLCESLSNSENFIQFVEKKKYNFEHTLIDEVSEEMIILKSKENSLKIIIKIMQKIIIKELSNSFAKIRLICKYQHMITLEKIRYSLKTIINRIFRKNVIILKKNYFEKLAFYYKTTKKASDHLKSLKINIINRLVTLLQKSYYKLFFTNFINITANTNEKVHSAEKIMNFISNIISKRQKLSLKKLSESKFSIKKISISLNTFVNTVGKKIKENFFHLLINRNVSKMKQYDVINQILSFSGKKNERMLILKNFHIWKRSIISSKIAAISKKYGQSTKTKKVANTISAVLRKSYKVGFNLLKKNSRQNEKKISYIILNNVLSRLIRQDLKFSLTCLAKNNKFLEIFSGNLKNLIRKRFFQVHELLNYFFNKRRIFVLFKTFVAAENRYEKFKYKKLFHMFGIFKRVILNTSYSPNIFEISDSLISVNEKKDLFGRLSPNMSLRSNVKHKTQIIRKKNSQSKNNFQKTAAEKKKLIDMIKEKNKLNVKNATPKPNNIKRANTTNFGLEIKPINLENLKSGVFMEYSNDNSPTESPITPKIPKLFENFGDFSDQNLKNFSSKQYTTQIYILDLSEVLTKLKDPIIHHAFACIKSFSLLTIEKIQIPTKSPWEIQLYSLASSILKRLVVRFMKKQYARLIS